MVWRDFLITPIAAMLAFWSLLVQNSVSLNTLPGCRCAGKTRLRGLFTSQLISRRSLRTSSFSLSIQSLGRDISQSALLLPFSALFGKLLILVGLIGGAGSLTDDDSFHEASSISLWDTMKTIETKSILANSVLSKIHIESDTCLRLHWPFMPSIQTGYLLSPCYSSPAELFTNSVFRSTWCWFPVPLLPPSINPNFTLKRENHFFPYSTKPKALFGVKTPLQMFHSPLLINFPQHYEMLPLMLMLINLTISPNIATAIIMYIDPTFLNILIIFSLIPHN